MAYQARNNTHQRRMYVALPKRIGICMNMEPSRHELAHWMSTLLPGFFVCASHLFFHRPGELKFHVGGGWAVWPKGFM